MSLENKRPTLVIHGGAGGLAMSIPGAPQLLLDKKRDLREIASVAWQKIMDKETARQVVVYVGSELENRPAFNAGYGAAIGVEGISLAACLMTGDYDDSKVPAVSHRKVASVNALTNFQNPSLLLNRLVDESPALLHGEIADEYAALIAPELGQKLLVSRWQLATPFRMAQYARWLQELQQQKKTGTAGVIVFDRFGNNAALTTTGQWTGHELLRVGDVPIPVAGTYVDRYGAASATGEGDRIIAQFSAGSVVHLLRKGYTPYQAARKIIKELGGEGGIIVADRCGNYGAFSNTGSMTTIFMRSGLKKPVLKMNYSV